MKYSVQIIIVFFCMISCTFSYSQGWQRLDSLRKAYMESQKYDSALIFAEEALKAAYTEAGEKDTIVANTLTALMQVNYYLGKYEESLSYAEKDVELRKEIQGATHPLYASALSNLALLNEMLGKFDKAESFYIEAVNIFKESGEIDSSEYAGILCNLAGLYKDKGNYAKTMPLYLEAMDILKRDTSVNYALVLNNLAILYRTIGDYEKAVFYYYYARDIIAKLLGTEHHFYSQILNNLSVLYEEMGNYSIAESLYKEAVALVRETLGPEHPEYAHFIGNLASFYKTMGNYAKAESLFKESLRIKEKTIGINHPDYAVSLNTLGNLYKEIGNNRKTEAMYKEALNIWEKSVGTEHPDYAKVLGNLALLYSSQGNFSDAETLHKKVIDIYKKKFGTMHDDYSISINNLALLYEDMGKIAEAESLLLESKEINFQLHGKKHRYYANSLNGLAALYSNNRQYEKAENLYSEANTIFKDIFGTKHPYYMISLINYANLYQRSSAFDKAEPLYIEYIPLMFESIRQNFSFLSENEKEFYLATKKNDFSSFYSFALERKNTNPEISCYVYDITTKIKGLLLKSSTTLRNTILTSNDSLLIAEYQKWLLLRKEILQLYSTPVGKRTNDPQKLEEEANQLEKNLVRNSVEFNNYNKLFSFSWKNVKENLKQNQAAIEFFHFTAKDTVRYCAVVLRHDSKWPEFVELFYENQLKEILERFKSKDYQYVYSLYGARNRFNTKLYHLIWQPLEKYLDGVKDIYYSPGGLLHTISFSAIANDKNTLLCDAYHIEQQSSTSNIGTKTENDIAQDLTVGLFGGIEYSGDSSNFKLWSYLEGTKNEVDHISKTFASDKSKTIYLTGAAASEEKLKKIALQCDILHISTHGFFFPEPDILSLSNSERGNDSISSRRYEQLGTRGYGVWTYIMNKNPLMRSGLVFAGANNVWNDEFLSMENDGVLTAQEVTQMDLRKVKLVVLSACETGLGDIKGSEGVYGLQRAFKIAGVNYLIMSLWQIPDKETEEFMTVFYSKLLEKQNIQTAFTLTQKELSNKYDPYYWAAFVLLR